MKRIKDFVDDFFRRDLRTPPVERTVEIDSAVEEAFFSFYRQQADEIQRHLAYERDLRGSLNGDDSVIVKFNVNMYLDRLDKYFSKKNLYSALMQNSYYKLLVTILIPEKSVSDQIPANIRKQLFLGMIDNTVMTGKINRKLFIKYIWEYINSLEQSINDTYPEKILEIFKETIAEQVSKKNIPVSDSDQIDVFQKLDILTEVLVRNRIRNQRDMKKLLYLSSTSVFIFKVVFLFFVAAGSFFSYPYFQNLFIENTVKIEIILQVVIVLTTLWLFLVLIIVSLYLYSMTKKRVLFRSISGIVKVLDIKPEVLKVFFRNKYSVDYRKIR